MHAERITFAAVAATGCACLLLVCFSALEDGGVRSELAQEVPVQVLPGSHDHAALKNPFDDHKPGYNPFKKKPLPAHLDWTRSKKTEKEKEQEEEEEEEEGYPHPWAYKPTKFGPLRRKAWTASRYHALALWEAADRSIETCMNADQMIFPNTKDNNCYDIDRTMHVLQECMRHQRDGFHGLADSKNGAWEALPELVSITNALSESDRAMVEKKVDSSAVLYTLARIEALHAECHGNDDASAQATPRDVLHKHGDPVTRASKVFSYIRRHGGVQPEYMPSAEGDWPIAMHWDGIKEEPIPPSNNDALRRAARRGYLQPPAVPRGH